MNEQITTIIVAAIGFLGSIGAALIASKKQVSKDITKISGKLPSWNMLYEHDSNGNMIAGKIVNLVEAIGNAYPIKVKIYPIYTPGYIFNRIKFVQLSSMFSGILMLNSVKIYSFSGALPENI